MNNLIIPYRGNMGVQTTPPFVNTYSLDFDGVDDYVNIGNGVSFEYTDAFSYSFWVKPNAVSGSKNLYTKYDAGRGIYTYLNSASGAGDNALYFFLLNTNSGSTATRKRITTNTGAIISPNVWTNIVITYDGSGLGTGINVYKNGVSQTVTVTQDNLQNSTIVNTVDSYLCAFSGISSFYSGVTDEFAIFNTELSATEALAIYGIGQPTDLTSLSPIAWYRNGDNGSYKSPQWLLPNNENKDKISNYSFEFDGVDDYVDCGNGALDITGSITLSCWVKSTNTGSNRKIIVKDDAGSNRSFQININHPSLGPYTYFWLGGGNIKSVFTSIPNQIVDGNWHHVVSVFKSGQYIRMYIDGVQAANTNVTETTLDSANTNFLISTDGYGGTVGIDGNVDSVSVWDSALEAVEIANLYNSGTPTDLSLLSTPPIAWYRMGEEATFSGGVWTVPDNVGSNNGTSNAMTIEDRVGEAPSSENNALSYNMDLVDRTTDVPT
tara:strand:- start:474 stop:1952 length:1479 start_codon:yes stop_codon:yes gene_type:complete